MTKPVLGNTKALASLRPFHCVPLALQENGAFQAKLCNLSAAWDPGSRLPFLTLHDSKQGRTGSYRVGLAGVESQALGKTGKLPSHSTQDSKEVWLPG